MSFVEGCSCHVWAIDGYRSDVLAHNVNMLYDNKSSEALLAALDGTRARKRRKLVADTNLDAKIQSLVEACRTDVSTALACTIYGGFQYATDGAPEHMWIEYGGHIYDTMPGQPLRRAKATKRTRLQPPCERSSFAADMVGSYESTLTNSQLAIITAAKDQWAKGWSNGGGSPCYEFTPP